MITPEVALSILSLCFSSKKGEVQKVQQCQIEYQACVEQGANSIDEEKQYAALNECVRASKLPKKIPIVVDT